MATNATSWGGTVFSVATPYRFAGLKQALAELRRLPVFTCPSGSSWEREYSYDRARGDKAWFLPTDMKRGISNIYLYRENGGIPYEAVAFVRGLNRAPSVVLNDHGWIVTKRRRAYGPLTPSASLQPATLIIPDAAEEHAPASWLTKLVNNRMGLRPNVRRDFS